jgi:hypothetical protein
MTSINKPGRLSAAVHFHGPGAFKPEWLGSGLLIRAPEVQLLPGPPTRNHSTRLAQSVRAPSS